jgi:hypothetical protein
MRRRKELPDWKWPSWRYGPGGQSAIFQKEEDVPEGWTKKPDDAPEVFIERVAPPPLDGDVLRAELTRRGIVIDPTWGLAHMKRVIDIDSNSTR